MTTGAVQAEHGESTSAAKPDPARAVRLGIGAGLLLAGTALLAFSAFAAEHPAWETLRAVRGYLAALFLAGGVGLLLSRRPAGWRIAVVLAAALFLYIEVDQLARSEHGFAAPGTGWSILGSCAIALGALLLPARGRSRRERGRTAGRPLAGVVAGVAAAALVAVLAPVSTAVTDGVAVDARTAAEVVVPDVPAQIEGSEAWRVDLDGVQQVTPGGAGFILGHEDGVSALDGTTGEERWHYTRPGADRAGTFVTPDGATVLVHLTSRVGSRYVVLDAVTGRVRHQGTPFGQIVPSSSSAPRVRPVTEMLTDSAFVRIVEEQGQVTRLVAASLTDGQELWRWSPATGCEFNENAWGTVTTGDRVVVTVQCGPDGGDVEELRLHGLVDTTGEQVWDRVIEVPERPADYPDVPRYAADWPFYAERGPDGLIAYTPQGFYPSTVDNLVLDAADGTEVARSPEEIDFHGPRIVLRDDAGHVLLDPRTGETVRWESDDERLYRPCARWNGLGLADQAVCVPYPEDPVGYGEHFALGGTLDGPLVITTPSGARARSVDVDLGGPFDFERGREFNPDWLDLVAGPGAVVVSSDVWPVEGASRELVGRR